MTWEAQVQQKGSTTHVGRGMEPGRSLDARSTQFFFWEPTRPTCLPCLVIWEGDEKKKAISVFLRFNLKEHPK